MQFFVIFNALLVINLVAATASKMIIALRLVVTSHATITGAHR